MKDLINNLSRFPRFFITVTLGIFFYLFDLLKPLGKKPVTAIALITLFISSITFIVFTLQAMLGFSSVS